MSRRRKSISPSISAEHVRLFRLESACEVLGPGRRAVLWVQGCGLACPGCLVPRSWPARGALLRSLEELVEWLVDLPLIEGLTLSGGEPMEQAGPLAELVRRTRQRRDLGVVCYTGYRLQQLQQPHQRALLEQVDLLIDGPYQQSEHADLRWRASRNQRLLYLSGRYSPPLSDRSAGLEFRLDAQGGLSFAGVPPWPDYVQAEPFR